MSETIVVVFYDSNGDPLPGLTPSFVSPGYYKTLAGVDTTAPLVTDGGDGDYSFVASDADQASGIRYLLDGGATASPRYFSGEVEPAASAQPATTVSADEVNLFTVTPTTLYTRHFSQWSAPTTDSNPSFATVAEIIDEQAATLSGYLLAEDIDGTSITVSNSPAYLWCRETLRLMAAIQVASEATQQSVPLLPVWEKQLAKRLAALDEQGNVALGGGVANPTEEPDGPTHFIDHLGLDTSANDDAASTVDMPFHKDDSL